MGKKIISLVLVLCFCFAVSVTAFAAAPGIAVSEVVAERGEEATVKVSLDGNPGIVSMKLTVAYDAKALEYKGAVVNSEFADVASMSEAVLQTDGTIIVNWMILGGNKNCVQNGTFAEIKFLVKETAVKGVSAVTVTYDEDDVYNIDEENVTFSVKNGSVTVNAPCDHKDTTTINAKEGTCKEAGYSGDTYCNECKTTIAYGKATAKDAKNHVGGTEVKNVKAGTCAEAGYTGDTCCKGCGEVIAEGKATAKDPANHTGKTELDKASAVEPDCKNSGKEANTICSGCKAILKEGKEIPATGKHGGGVATCTAKAVCTGCGIEYGELDPKNHGNHETEVKNAKEADCTEAGYTGDIYCKGCKNKIETGKVVDALGHKGGEATCQAKAVCEVCKEEYGELGEHKGGEATCTAKAVCEVCQEEYGELAEHKFGNWVVEKEATYTEEGLAKRECENCDEVEEKEIAKKRRPSDDKGLVVDLTGKDEGEANPNTGAVITLSSTVGVISAVAAVAIFRKRK